jgi:hypothetical protein
MNYDVKEVTHTLTRFKKSYHFPNHFLIATIWEIIL